jgi:hypothetical protein
MEYFDISEVSKFQGAKDLRVQYSPKISVRTHFFKTIRYKRYCNEKD